MAQQIRTSICDVYLRAKPVALVSFTVAAILLAVVPVAEAQTFTVLHAFGGTGDGSFPLSGVTMDAHGNLYGTTTGSLTNSTVYKLTHTSSGWIYSQLYTHGTNIEARVAIGPDGSLYGTESTGGPESLGVVFNLRPPATFCHAIDCFWTLTPIYTFQGPDGDFPTTITFDSAGNIYGTTVQGGVTYGGVVYKLTNNQGSWSYTQITDFDGTTISEPGNGVVVDASGNLYGTTLAYPGQIFEVTSSGQPQLIYQFDCCMNGLDTYAGVILDNEGNLYGTTAFRGPGGNGGTTYELSPSNGDWTLATLQGFPGPLECNGTIGTANLLMDPQGNLYGTSFCGGAYDYGEVYKLAPSDGGWIYTDLHDFTGGEDGCYPWDGLGLDSEGNLYGTASECGQYGGHAGTLWQITP